MVAAVQFHPDMRLLAVEVDYVTADSVLSPELCSCELTTSERPPESTFGICGAPPQIARLIEIVAVTASLGQLFSPHPFPSPVGRGEYRSKNSLISPAGSCVTSSWGVSVYQSRGR